MGAVIAILAAVALMAIYVGLTYNRLVGLRLASENSWAQVDVALKLRHDLVPALSAAVGGYATHERQSFEEVARIRADAVAAGERGPAARAPIEGALSAGVGRMVILSEAYPELRASENFADLQQRLSDIEEKIAISRRVYNDTVQTLNTKVAVFPSVIVARLLGFGAREFFEAPVGSEAVPDVGAVSASGGGSG